MPKYHLFASLSVRNKMLTLFILPVIRIVSCCGRHNLYHPMFSLDFCSLLCSVLALSSSLLNCFKSTQCVSVKRAHNSLHIAIA